jgi:hypothetical protein
MNLVVVAGSRATAERYTAIVDEVTQSIPSRAIIVALEPEAPSSALEGDVSAVCTISPGAAPQAAPGVEAGQAVCSERIRLTVTGGGMCARAGSAVDALLVPEIPTTLLWLGRVHAGDPVFQSIAGEANRILVDTAHTPLSSLVHLAHWTRQVPTRPKLADLAWTRLAPWQELCARFFDEPRLRDLSGAITKVSLQQASEKGANLGSQGLLLLAWLATRLGWQAARLGGSLRFKRPDGASVALEIGAVPRPEGVATGTLAAFTIDAEDKALRIHGAIQRDLGTNVAAWRLQIDDESAIEQSIRLTVYSEASVLERTLHRPPYDGALEDSVRFAEDFVEDGITCN